MTARPERCQADTGDKLRGLWNLKAAIALPTAVFVLLGGLVLGLAARPNLEAVLDGQKQARIDAVIQQSHHFDHLFRSASDGLAEKARAASLLWAPAKPEQQSDVLQGIVTGTPDFFSISLVDANGFAYLTLPAANANAADTLIAGPDMEKLLKGELARVAAPGIRSPDGRPLVLLGVPVVAPDGRTVGAVVGLLDLSRPDFQHEISAMVYGSTGYNSLMDANGTVLLSSRPGRVFAASHMTADIPKISGGRTPVIEEYPDDDQPSGREIVAVAGLQSAPVFLAVEQDLGEFMRPLDVLRRNFAVAGGTLFTITLVFGLVAAAYIARPVLRLSQSAARISSGDLDAPVVAGGLAEVSRLGESLDRMRQSLKLRFSQTQRQKEQLEQLRKLSLTLSSTLNLDKVLDIALEGVERIVADSQATVGIALLDEWKQHLSVVAARGPFRDQALAARMPVASLPEDMIRPLMKERVPWVLEDISRAPGVLLFVPGVSEQRKVVVVPLSAGEEPIGLLFIASQAQRLPGQDDMALLGTYARHAALAVVNARIYTSTDMSLRRRVKDLESLTSVLSASRRQPELDGLLEDVLPAVCNALGADQAAVILPDDEGVMATVRAEYRRPGIPPAAPRPQGISLPLASLSERDLVSRGQALAIEDTEKLTEEYERRVITSWGARSVLMVPMVMGGTVVGTIAFSCVSGPRSYSTEEVSLAQALAGHLASIVAHARLYESALRERHTLESIVSSMAEALIVTDTAGTATYCNHAAEELLQVAATDIVGRPARTYFDVLSTRIAEPADWRQVLAEHISHGDAARKFHIVMQTPDRREVAGILFDIISRGRRLGTGMLLRDVTKEREVDRMKTEFVSIASHELRTPMTAVYGFAELLLSNCSHLSEKHRGWLETIHKESKRLSDMVDDLLNVSRIEAGGLAVKSEPVDVEYIVKAIVAQMAPVHQRHDFQVVMPLGPVTALADNGRLHQVIFNLVDNAVKYSPRGGKVEVVLQPDPQDSRRAVVSVSDQGVGIPAEEMPRLFTRFHRIRRPETAELRGTGLGLYIVKSLVEMMHGRVKVESKPDQGSVFYVSLIRAQPPVSEARQL